MSDNRYYVNLEIKVWQSGEVTCPNPRGSDSAPPASPASLQGFPAWLERLFVLRFQPERPWLPPLANPEFPAFAARPATAPPARCSYPAPLPRTWENVRKLLVRIQPRRFAEAVSPDQAQIGL